MKCPEKTYEAIRYLKNILLGLLLLFVVQTADGRTAKEVFNILPGNELRIAINTGLSNNILPPVEAFLGAPQIRFGDRETQTQISFLAGSKTLFLLMEMTTPQVLAGDIGNTMPERLDADLSQEESVTLFFDPNLRRRNWQYLSINPFNQYVDGRIWSRNWKCPVNSQVSFSGNKWLLSLGIPLGEMAGKVAGEYVFGLNFRRVAVVDGDVHREYFRGNEWSCQEVGNYLPIIVSNPLSVPISRHGNNFVLEDPNSAGLAVTLNQPSGTKHEIVPVSDGKAAFTLNPASVGRDAQLILSPLAKSNLAKGSRFYQLQHYFDPISPDWGGMRLPARGHLQLWSAPLTAPIKKKTPLPEERAEKLVLSVPGGGSAGKLLMLHPEQNWQGSITLSDLTGPDGYILPASAVKLYQVEFLSVTSSPGGYSYAGKWPDPLRLYRGGTLQLRAGENTPVAISLEIPRGTPGGVYRGGITFVSHGNSEGDGNELPLPMEVIIYPYQLDVPEKAMFVCGLSGDIADFQGATGAEDLAVAQANSFKLFADYGVSPRNFLLTPDLAGEDGTLDLTGFSQWAERYFGEYNFRFLNMAELPPVGDAEAFRTLIAEKNWSNFLYYLVDRDREDRTLSLEMLHNRLPEIKILRLDGQDAPGGNRLEFINRVESSLSNANSGERFCTVSGMVRYPRPAAAIDVPHALILEYFLLAEKFGWDGLLAGAADALGRDMLLGRPDPWMTPRTRMDSGRLLGNGENRYFYPAIARDEAEKFEVWPSLRLMMIREGVNEHRMIAMFRKKLNQAVPLDSGNGTSDPRAALQKFLLSEGEKLLQEYTSGTFSADEFVINLRQREQWRDNFNWLLAELISLEQAKETE